MPQVSDTEQAAIDAGTVWWDAELFGGRPNWSRLLAVPAPQLTPAEQSFLDNECEKLCDLSNDWESTQLWQDLPPDAWQYVKDAGFLGMIIPKRYGGLEFSAYAHSQVIQKLATRCSAAAVSVMVPNSLGPAELLLHYGTEEQKNYYLPRLAKGDEIPCFALTAPYAGSDASSLTDTGIVCKGTWEGRETLGLRVTWNKRYITLAPIATVLGLAFRAQDPDGLLGGEKDLGITCALVPRNTPGVNIGRRHWPLNAVFQIGPTSGTDVFIPLDFVIGGRAEIGRGWRMLMDCLAAGRAISLPSSNTGMSKLAVRTVGAYSAIRRQFNTPVGKFEGVAEPLARMGGNLYMMDAARRLSAVAIDIGEKPAVVSAIAKYHVTERARDVVNDAMDVVGGKGICLGPKNFLARAYEQIPIAITVEGANIMTRTLIIFGQGVIRCHPYVLKIMRATTERDRKKAAADFDAALFGQLGFVTSTVFRAFFHGLTGGAFLKAPAGAAGELHAYYRGATRLSISLALVSDASLATLGGTLKRKESITGRLGDVLSQLYLISATLKRYEDEGRLREDLPFVHWSIQDALVRAQDAFEGVFANYPNQLAAKVLRFLAFPLGFPFRKPSDAVSFAIAAAVQKYGPARDRLLAGSWVPRLEVDPIAAVEVAMSLYAQVEAIERRVLPAVKAGKIGKLPQNFRLLKAWAAEAQGLGLIGADDFTLLERFAEHADSAIQVDDFAPDFDASLDLERRNERLHEAAHPAAVHGGNGVHTNGNATHGENGAGAVEEQSEEPEAVVLNAAAVAEREIAPTGE